MQCFDHDEMANRLSAVMTCCDGVEAEHISACLKSILTSGIEDGDIADSLVELFPELSSHGGTYAQIDDLQGRDKAISSMLSAVWMVTNRYDDFVKGQKPHKRLSNALWEQLRAFKLWDDFKEDEFHGDLFHPIGLRKELRALLVGGDGALARVLPIAFVDEVALASLVQAGLVGAVPSGCFVAQGISN